MVLRRVQGFRQVSSQASLIVYGTQKVFWDFSRDFSRVKKSVRIASITVADINKTQNLQLKSAGIGYMHDLGLMHAYTLAGA